MHEESEAASSADASAFEPLVAHARQMWAAEEENSRRNLERTKLLAAALLAFLAVGLFRFGVELFGPPSTIGDVISRVLLVIGLLMMARAAPYLFNLPPWRFEWAQRRRRRIVRNIVDRLEKQGRLNASAHLFPEPEDLDCLGDPDEGTEANSLKVVFVKTITATAHLHFRNSARNALLILALRRFNLGLIFMFLAVGAHLASPLLDTSLSALLDRL